MTRIYLFAGFLSSLLLTGCSGEEALLLAMEVSLTEQFEAACSGNAHCIKTVASSAEGCFDPELARTALDAPADAQRQANTQQILGMQSCLAKAAGQDFWRQLDMPRRILEQVSQES